MKMPGFNAGASLYKSRMLFRTVTMYSGNLNGGVRPALPPPPNGGPHCTPRCGPCVSGMQNCIDADCEPYQATCQCNPYCAPPVQNANLGGCLWQHCRDAQCNWSWQSAPGCTPCEYPGFQQCRDASGNCIQQPCRLCYDSGCIAGDCWSGGQKTEERWCLN